ncbi:MAG TPA: DNA polymerase III subunit alpha [Chloroflexota bacterium]|nr:DNA polymerase III subunit alpha [Chloroflexota bacterium]
MSGAALHVHSTFSLLRGASPVEELVERAAALGYAALGLTDRDALYGAVRHAKACAAAGLRPVIGTEITLESGDGLTLLAENQTGYANLCRLISTSRLAHPKGEAALPLAALAERAAGVIALSGGRNGAIPRLLLAGQTEAARKATADYQGIFGERFYLEIQNHLLPDDAWLMAEIATIGKQLQIPVVATTDVHYADLNRRVLQDILTCIRTRTTMAAPSEERLPNGHYGLKPPDEFARLFQAYPDALVNAEAIAARCAVSLDFRQARFPPLDLPNGETVDAALRRLCFEGARQRYPALPQRVTRQLDHELSVVAQAGLAPFFLIAADVALRFHGRCRGSAAGSLIVYCLGVSAVDPLRYGMLFERFINPERPTLPDIDIDFAEWDREAAISYVYATYGADRAAMVCNYVRYRARLGVRDVGKALGMPADLLDRLAKSLDHHLAGDELIAGIAGFARNLSPEVLGAQPWGTFARTCAAIDDVPRHLSVHVGGMLVTGQPLIELFGLEPARKEGIVVVGADKEDVEDAGLGKLDLLCLRALSVIQEAEALERQRGVPLDIRSISLEDPEIYRMLTRADTIGASQVESRAQQQSVVRTRPRQFRDLINQCAIIRPGPIVSGMVHPYNRRRLGLEKVTYLHPCLEPITRDTLGIFLFQEQIILGVMALTGCSAGEADVFRRAMGSHRSREAMRKLEPWFMDRAQLNGIGRTIAAEAFRQISSFADFGFCRSHSAALARTAYEGLYLKRYHPAAFYAALVSNQPMGFYPTEVLIWDARRHGIRFLPVDVNLSGARCGLGVGSPPIRLGFSQVRWVGKERARAIVAEREAGGPYRSLRDFLGRTGLVGKPVEGLILAGAFDFEGRARSELLWELYGHDEPAGQRSLAVEEARPDLPERTSHDNVLLDHLVLGFSLDRHLAESYRRRLRALGVVESRALEKQPADGEVRVGGLVVCRQRPQTAKGYVFLTLEDAYGLVNVIAAPDVFQQYRDALRNGSLIAVAGRLQRAYGTINVLARRAISLDLTRPDAEPAREHPLVASVPSHDFH